MRNALSEFNDFQQQFLVHPDITYLGLREGADGTIYNQFAHRTTWVEFRMPREFDGRAGDSAAVIWPWDIAFFLRDVAPYVGAIASAPEAAYKFLLAMAKLGPTQAAAREIVRNELWRDLFREIGTNEQVQKIQPQVARWCRIVGGLEPAPPQPEKVDFTDFDPKVATIIRDIAVSMGIILTASAAAVGLILGIVATAVAVAPVATAGALAIPIIAGTLIVVTVSGWVLFTVVEIVKLIMDGLLILNPSKTDALSEAAPQLVASVA